MPSLDFDAIKAQIPMSDVLRLINWKFVWARGGQERGPCPIHGSTSARSRSFCVFRDGWYCHKCRLGGDQLRLWAELHRMPIYEATIDLCRAVGKPVFFKRRQGRYE